MLHSNKKRYLEDRCLFLVVLEGDSFAASGGESLINCSYS